MKKTTKKAVKAVSFSVAHGEIKEAAKKGLLATVTLRNRLADEARKANASKKESDASLVIQLANAGAIKGVIGDTARVVQTLAKAKVSPEAITSVRAYRFDKWFVTEDKVAAAIKRTTGK